MPTVKSYKYRLGGDYTVEKQNGVFYKFTKNGQTVCIPESDIGKVEGFSEGENILNVRSRSYGMIGIFEVEKINGTFYKFTKGNTVVFVPESDIGKVEGFSNGNTKTNENKLNNTFGEMIGIYHKYVKKDGTETFIPQYIVPESFNNGTSGGSRYKHRRVTKKARRTRRR